MQRKQSLQQQSVMWERSDITDTHRGNTTNLSVQARLEVHLILIPKHQSIGSSLAPVTTIICSKVISCSD